MRQKFSRNLFILITFISCQNKPEQNQSVSNNSEVPSKKVSPIEFEIGDTVDVLNGVAVFYNGEDYTKDYGCHRSKDGYLLGQKWQCVEFIKRYYYQRFQHKMPNVYGHAIHFFNPQVAQGKINPDRNLLQYRNGGEMPPQPDDILVFDRRSAYGHIAVVSKVEKDQLEIVQQNILGKPREVLAILKDEGKYWVGERNDLPAGWLRIKK